MEPAVNDVIAGMGSDAIKAIVVIGVVGCGAIAAAIRWATNRITKSIDDGAQSHVAAAEKASAAMLAAAKESAAAQLAAAEKVAAAALEQAVAFETLRGEVRAVAEHVVDRPSSRSAAGSGGRSFTPSPDR